MSELTLSGIPVNFPFKPYDVQKSYMEKVIECLQNSTNALLESPTGTGKTLCLLCSSLAWLMVKKAQLQINIQLSNISENGGFVTSLKENLKSGASKQAKDPSSWGMPKIIYASRTHSQLTQAMQELKRSSYRHVRAAVLGSRDQMCIHPEVSKETNNVNKVHMCSLKVKSRTCQFYNNVESKKDDQLIKGDILDIEDLVSVGKKLKCCPYYLAKELKQEADIVFMPYNYILDPKSRKANGVELVNNIIILDEAHNVEKMCEESASLQLKSTDIALCIAEITHVMQAFSESQEQLDITPDTSQPKDFTCEDLCVLKEIILAFEKALDEIDNVTVEGSTFPGGFIFDILSKAEIRDHNQASICNLIDNLIQYLSNTSASPFQRKGVGLQKMADLLQIVYSSTSYAHKERVKLCYKVHIQTEENKNKKADSWANLKSNCKSSERVLSYWCFSPGFGMKQLLEQNVRSIILTSGTLAPLKPTISELGIPIGVQLENPHVVGDKQIFVKIITQGPDGTPLNSNYQNRDNPKYISAMGRTILSFCRVVPDGLLVFFPSYPIMSKCREQWQSEGIWGSICNIKPIFVEPQRKDTFNSVMCDYYNKINEPSSRGACFMAVCRGKVSEGLDFADINGRAVIVTGLPFPPLKDPRIILKKKYLDEMKAKDKDFLSGDEWYSLEASRAVNQAIGRVIRHKNDYGAILLCDSRFGNPQLKKQLSSWLRDYLRTSRKFGETVGEVCRFFKNAEAIFPSARLKPALPGDQNPYATCRDAPGLAFSSATCRPLNKARASVSLSQYPNSNEVYADCSMNFYKIVNNGTDVSESKPRQAKDLFSALDSYDGPADGGRDGEKRLDSHQADDEGPVVTAKRRKLKIKPFGFESCLEAQVSGSASSTSSTSSTPDTPHEWVRSVKRSLPGPQYRSFGAAVARYRQGSDYGALLAELHRLLSPDPATHHLLRGMIRFLKEEHKPLFKEYCDRL